MMSDVNGQKSNVIFQLSIVSGFFFSEAIKQGCQVSQCNKGSRRQNEQYKSIPFHSKQGRGLLAHYMIEKCITDLEELKNFCSLGYRYDSELSFPNHFVYKKDKSH